MKKLLFILLSVVLIGSAGCGSDKNLNTAVTDAGSAEVVKAPWEPAGGADQVETGETAETVDPESTEAVKEEDAEKDNRLESSEADDKPADNKQTGGDKGSDDQNSAKQPEETKSQPASVQQPKPEPEPQAVVYSPDRVVSIAISKCQTGGMVTTEQHLKDNLNSRKITQEEYDEYYPLDGLEESYYSVFVNADLNKAATTSGRTLGSEEEVAQYIADMLLLEPDPVFNIRYAGTTKTSGETFYEFRCYR